MVFDQRTTIRIGRTLANFQPWSISIMNMSAVALSATDRNYVLLGEIWQNLEKKGRHFLRFFIRLPHRYFGTHIHLLLWKLNKCRRRQNNIKLSPCHAAYRINGRFFQTHTHLYIVDSIHLPFRRRSSSRIKYVAKMFLAEWKKKN